MATKTLKFVNSKELEIWLKDKPMEWAQTIATRSAMRVFPLVLSLSRNVDNSVQFEQQQRMIFNTWRSLFMSWVSRGHPAQDMRVASASAATAAHGIYAAIEPSSASSAAAIAAYAAADAATATDTATATDIACIVANAAAKAVNATNESESIVWAALSADVRILEAAEREAVFSLLSTPLWIETTADNKRHRVYFPEVTREAFDQFKDLGRVRNGPWGIIVDWYRAVLPSDRNAKPFSLFGNKADVSVAMQPENFWRREPEIVLTEIAEIVGWGQKDKANTSETMKEFIMTTLDRAQRPVSIDEFQILFDKSGYKSPRESIRGRLNELTKDNQIQRVDRASYASMDWINPANSSPRHLNLVPDPNTALPEEGWQPLHLRPRTMKRRRSQGSLHV